MNMTNSANRCPFSGTLQSPESSVAPHAAQMRFDALLESTHDAVIAINRNGLILFWNHAASNLFGYSSDEAVGTSVEIIIPDKYVEAHRTGMERVLGGGERHVIGNTAELTGKRKDGSTFPIELSLSTWSAGGDMYFAGIIRDISQRKEHERVIIESERRFRSLNETASDAIVSANHTGNIVSWNAAAHRIFGYSAEEVLNKPLEIIIPAKYREGHKHGLQRVAEGGDQHVIGHTVELEGLHKDGYSFPIELSLSCWSTEQGMHFCGIIRDITERKKSERALQKSKEKLTRQTDKLKKANTQIHQKTVELQNLSQKLAKYLSHQVYNSIFEGEREVRIESYRKQLTVFFSDIQGFTELSDKVEAEVLTQVLNSYLNEMSLIANEHGGTIDKFIGDAIMIFFGDPESRGTKEDALACVQMAMDMRNRLDQLQKHWETLGNNKPMQVRMGINTSYCTVGNLGSEERMDYTIVGSEVNLAHRLESHADTNQILISQSTQLLIKDEIACTSKQEIQVKGFSEPVLTYQVLGTKESIAQDARTITQELEGFALDIDPALLENENKTMVREILERALALVKT
jgi:PAS domain S-box-containing protein